MIVPKEPTEEMLESADGDKAEWGCLIRDYKAMLAAAPDPCEGCKYNGIDSDTFLKCAGCCRDFPDMYTPEEK